MIISDKAKFYLDLLASMVSAYLMADGFVRHYNSGNTPKMIVSILLFFISIIYFIVTISKRTKA